MPGSVTSVFSEPDDFQVALRGEGVLGLVITGCGQFRARLTQVVLHRARLSAAEEHFSRIAFVAVPADLILVSLPIGTRLAPIWGGVATHAGGFLTLGPGQRAHARTEGPSLWGSIWLPAEEFLGYGRALVGDTFAVPSGIRSWRSSPAAERCLRQLHGAGTRMAGLRPGILVGAEAAHGLEQQLIHAMVECLSAESAQEAMASAPQRQEIMVRFEELLQEEPDRNLRLAEICAALGVSERRLRALCAEHLGTGPASYIRLRRMSSVYRTLWRGDREAATVSQVARRFGFRDLGRFAGTYRDRYGEFPSATLRRSLRPGAARLVLRRPRSAM